ncbi:MAG: hypothetical protein DRJ42_08205 [Deltaproteobacteria bacterium]|nr:MAG: hypothetical protein DRJ42_08205 [Deltaproteobacteria bacterium]
MAEGSEKKAAAKKGKGTLTGVGAVANPTVAKPETKTETKAKPETKPKAKPEAKPETKPKPRKGKGKGTLVGVGAIKKMPKVPKLSGPAVVSSRKGPKGILAKPPVAPPPSRKLPPLPSDAPPAPGDVDGASGEIAGTEGAIPPPANLPAMGSASDTAGDKDPQKKTLWLLAGGAVAVAIAVVAISLIVFVASLFGDDEADDGAEIVTADGTQEVDDVDDVDETANPGPPADQLDPEGPIEGAAPTPLPEPRTLTAEEEERFEGFRENARTHFGAESFGEAAAAYRAATVINPTHAGSFAGLGAALSRGGDLSGAVEAYEMAVRLTPDSSGYHAALGRVLRESGDDGRAREEYRRALELAPDNRAARRALRELGMR